MAIDKNELVNKEVRVQWRDGLYLAYVKGRKNKFASVVPHRHIQSGRDVYENAPSFEFSWESVERAWRQGSTLLCG
jgi:hypothetical protein